jgi:hypothetical protein
MRKVDGHDDLISMQIPEDVGREAVLESRTEEPLSFRARREFLAQMLPRYQHASSAHKSKSLDLLVEWRAMTAHTPFGCSITHQRERWLPCVCICPQTPCAVFAVSDPFSGAAWPSPNQ